MSTYKNSPYSNSTYMHICETANMYISKSNVCTSDNMKICDIFDSIFSGRWTSKKSPYTSDFLKLTTYYSSII